MDGHRCITQHGLRAGGGHDHFAGTVRIGIAEVIELALGGIVLHLIVRQGGETARAPVDDVVALVDQPFVIEANKDLTHGFGQAIIHSEAFSVPIAGSAHPFELVDNGAALFFLPLPDPLNEFFSAQVMAGCILCGQLSLHHVLGGNASMIRAWYPEGVITLHAVVTGQQILESVVQSMANMEHAGNVGRWNHNGKGILTLCHFRSKGLMFQPVVVPALLYFFKGIGFGEVIFGRGLLWGGLFCHGIQYNIEVKKKRRGYCQGLVNKVV
ncbi:hypothetical protein H206_06312 [Candidatus Electrothrix aarhusensis]|uniref:Uncharacterized protein n=1 Tax=Candidatus Electrothrix aarhusensis TaxID=1859131 RepID=A0A3S3R9P8_9BACT|nr:hypothetical protein H206_06312 [Candidatus Electrothrix aarhusensis]